MWVAAATAVGVVLTALGVKDAIAAWVRRRRPSQAEEITTLNAATLKWAETLREDAEQTHQHAEQTHQQLTEVRREAGQALAELARMQARLWTVEQTVVRILHLIHDTPDMTLERLRTLVPEAPPRGDT